MQLSTMHPNTRLLVDAWRRMAANPDQVAHGPQASEHLSLIDRLFVLNKTADDAWVFSNAGRAMSQLLGRELEDHDFQSLWTGQDRIIMAALVNAVSREGEPSLIRLHGESLRGFRCDVEVTLAPLNNRAGNKILGLYQTLGGEAMLRGQAIWRHRIQSLNMPVQRSREPRIRLVASND